MKLDEIRIGSVIDIYIRRNNSAYKTVSKVEYTDEKFIGVTPIASKHGLFRFHKEDDVDIVYREGDKYWKWEHVKTGIARRKDGSRLHIFSAPVRAVQFNRRTQFRFEIGTEIKMKYEIMKKDDTGEKGNGKTPSMDLDNILLMLDEHYEEVECRGYLKDLSEGGASVETDVKLDKGVFVSFSIDSELGTVSLRGVIIRVKEDKHGYFDYTYGVSFVETSKNYMQYFYLQQRKQLYEQNNDND